MTIVKKINYKLPRLQKNSCEFEKTRNIYDIRCYFERPQCLTSASTNAETKENIPVALYSHITEFCEARRPIIFLYAYRNTLLKQ